MTTSSITTRKSVSQPIGVAAVVAGGLVLLLMLLTRQPPSTVVAKKVVSDVSSDEQIVFFPGYATHDESHAEWVVHVHAWWFERESNSTRRKFLRAGIQRLVDVPEDKSAIKRFNRRIGRFLADGERGKTVAVELGGKSFTLGETDKAGQCDTTIRIGDTLFSRLKKQADGADGWIALKASLESGDRRRFAGSVLPIGEKGLSVVSDIDDTIKITQVTNRDAMIANSLYRPFRPAPGMSKLYESLRKRGAVFHYVSGSPWQLYEPLAEFMTQYKFPRGTMHLRRFRLKDIRTLPDIAKPSNKREAIEALLADFPKRRFLFFGDSGERDPEIYADLLRKHPGQVAGIFIRNVTHEKPDSPRMTAAFQNVESGRWMLFDQPDAAGKRALMLSRE